MLHGFCRQTSTCVLSRLNVQFPALVGLVALLFALLPVKVMCRTQTATGILRGSVVDSRGHALEGAELLLFAGT